LAFATGSKDSDEEVGAVARNGAGFDRLHIFTPNRTIPTSTNNPIRIRGDATPVRKNEQ